MNPMTYNFPNVYRLMYLLFAGLIEAGYEGTVRRRLEGLPLMYATLHDDHHFYYVVRGEQPPEYMHKIRDQRRAIVDQEYDRKNFWRT